MLEKELKDRADKKGEEFDGHDFRETHEPYSNATNWRTDLKI